MSQAGRLELPLPSDFLAETLHLPDPVGRRWPVDLSAPRHITRTTEISLPAGHSLESPHPPLALSGPGATFLMTVQGNGPSVRIQYDLALRQHRFSPDEYRQVLRFLDDVRDASRTSLVFVRDDSSNDLARQRTRLKKNPSDFEALYQMGLVHLRRGRFADAIAAFRESLTLNPASVPVHLGLASAFESQGNLPDAIAALQWVVDQRPRDFHTWNRLSVLHEKKGDLEAAVLALERSVQANPYLDETRASLERLRALRNTSPEPRP